MLADQERPAEPVRFMIGIFLLKHTYALSDKRVWNRWVHDPYFQDFNGGAVLGSVTARLTLLPHIDFQPVRATGRERFSWPKNV